MFDGDNGLRNRNHGWKGNSVYSLFSRRYKEGNDKIRDDLNGLVMDAFAHTSGELLTHLCGNVLWTFACCSSFPLKMGVVYTFSK